jgi:hypothetical protein
MGMAWRRLAMPLLMSRSEARHNKRTQFETKSRAHARPKDGFADGQFPTKGAKVAFGTAVVLTR